MYCETHTSHNFMFVLTWLYGVIVSDGGVESHCETIEIAIAGILYKFYAWIQVVYLNRSHSLLLNRLLLYVFHLFYTFFLWWYGSSQLSYLWRSTSRQSVVQLTYDANHQHFSNFKSKTWKVKGLALTFTESFGPRQSIIAYQPYWFWYIASCHHYVMWSTYMISSYEDFTSSFIRKLLNR